MVARQSAGQSALPSKDEAIHRSIRDLREVTAYISFARARTTLTAQVRVAGMRWTVEDRIQTAKGAVGVDHYAVRSWTGWYRHMSLALWAHAFVSVIREETGAEVAPKKGMQNRRGPRSLAAFKAYRAIVAVFLCTFFKERSTNERTNMARPFYLGLPQHFPENLQYNPVSL